MRTEVGDVVRECVDQHTEERPQQLGRRYVSAILSPMEREVVGFTVDRPALVIVRKVEFMPSVLRSWVLVRKAPAKNFGRDGSVGGAEGSARPA